MGFGDSSLFSKITCILLIVAVIIQILGLALPYWVTITSSEFDYNLYYGLWKICHDGICIDNTGFTGPVTPDYLKATQALELLGLFFIMAALAVTIVFVFVKRDKKILQLVGCILSFCASNNSQRACYAGFIIIGIIIFGAKSPYTDFSGAFAITIIAGIICSVAGGLDLMDWMGKGK